MEELKPQYMRGYGELPEAAATELNGIVGELRGLVSKLDRYLAEGVGQDLKSRLQRLEQKSNDLELLSKIEEIAANRGLVGFARRSARFWTEPKTRPLKLRFSDE